MTEKTCDHETGGKFCPKCGKQLVVTPVTITEAAEGILDYWLRKGFRDTFLQLLIRPGFVIADYLRRDRSLLIKPAVFLTVVFGVRLALFREVSGTNACSLVQHLECDKVKHLLFWFQFVQAMAISLLMRWAPSRDSPYSFMEHVVFWTFIIAESLLISSVLEVALYFIALPATPVLLGARFAYQLFALIQFSGPKKPADIARISALLLTGYAITIALLLLVLLWLWPFLGLPDPL